MDFSSYASADYGSFQGELHVRFNPLKDQLALLCPMGIVLSLESQPTSAHTHKLIISHLGGQVKTWVSSKLSEGKTQSMWANAVGTVFCLCVNGNTVKIESC